ncbi:MAG: FAD-dependent oxidoreductase [Clostridia bacterium]|nr:FAD-dependent oxidoreductase [Clostridia bacterium]
MEKKQKYDTDKLYDVIVIGGGPAGLTAALYLARAKYRVLVLEKEQFGGQITITHEVVNYPGIGRTSGKKLTETIQRQADAFGAEFLLAAVKSLDLNGDVKTVGTDKGDYYCLGILLATGAHPRTVGFKGEEEHKGRGVAYCATCDGEFFTGKEVFVVGGGFAAAEESVFLTKFAKHVTILIREDDFTCAAAVAEPARKHEKITILTNTVVEEVSGDGGLDSIRYQNTVTGKITEYRAEDGETFGVFVFAGYAPATDLINGVVKLNEQGYIITDSEQRTNIEGVYAAGDVCIKPLRQVVTATGDGALAATELEKYVAAVQRRTGISAKSPVAKGYESVMSELHEEASEEPGELFSSEMKAQLRSVFEKMQQNVILKLYLDERLVSRELENYMQTLASLSDKLTVEVEDSHASSEIAPCVKICLGDKAETGLAFHGVPGGHEFTSFVLGIYNAAGPGQAIDEESRKLIESIRQPTDIKVLVSLSCTMCPDTVVAAQQIAAKNPNVRAEVYDLQHFEGLKKRHNVMSVPCILINDSTVSFGKKNISQILELIGR